MRRLTFIAILVMAVVMLSSCGTSNHDVKARAYSVFKDMTGQWHREIGVEFIEVNPMSQVGDTVHLDDEVTAWYFVITSKDTTQGGVR
jgi:hypothetical protein